MDANKPHDCSEVISRVFLSLDGELSKEEEKEFFEEIKRCSWCLEHYNIEQAFKEFICSKLGRKEVNPKLITEIKSKIKNIPID
jgi:anti-sigma factor (TIGR02949 family)